MMRSRGAPPRALVVVTGVDWSRYACHHSLLDARRRGAVRAGRGTHRTIVLGEAPAFISAVVVAETAWVLERTYKFTASEIALAVEAMLQVDVFVVECEAEVFRAIVAVRNGHSFADAFIGELGIAAGCSHTLTFDRRAARMATFELIGNASG
jgi:predicted nucleic-acid-binding protein